MRDAVSTLGRPVLGLLLVLALGSLADVAFGFLPRRLASRWPLRGLFGLAVLYLAMAEPPLLMVLTVIGFATRLRRRSTVQQRVLRGDVLTGVAIAVSMVVVVALRARTPFYWDEFVWMAKARLEADHPFSLVDEVLRGSSTAIPYGYPTLEPLSMAALSGWDGRMPALMTGSAFLQLLIAMSFALLALDRLRGRSRRSLAVALALSCSPLVLIHLRSAYVDLETGLLAATVLVLLELRLLRAAAAIAVVLVGMKDEGAIHLLAVTFATFVLALGARERRAMWRSAVVGLVGAAVFGYWHLRLRVAGVVRTDHMLSGLAFRRLPELIAVGSSHLLDVLAWGPLFAVTGGLMLAVLGRPRRYGRQARQRLMVLASQVGFLSFGLMATSDRVMEFARQGTLLGRLLVELTPVALLAIAGAV